MPILHTHSPPKGSEKEGAAAFQEGPALLGFLSQFLLTFHWNSATLCDLPLNLGAWGTGFAVRAALVLSTLCPLPFLALAFHSGPHQVSG